MDITSLSNPRIKQLVRLRDDKKYRQIENKMIVEGWDEITLAVSAGFLPQTLLISPELTDRRYDDFSSEVLTLTSPVFNKISYRENPDGWMAVFQTPKLSLNDIKLGRVPFLIVAEAIEKPGNLGAILRTADAAGVDAILVTDPRTDIHNPNVVRASRGTLFTVPTIELSNKDALSFLKEKGILILAASPQAEKEYSLQDLSGPLAVVVGTEDKGLTDLWLSEADIMVKIPMIGKINSLNVSIATALIVYEVVRQRSMKH